MLFFQKSLTNFFGQLLLIILGMFTSILTARLLGPAGKGALSLVLLLPTVLVHIFSFSISNSNIYYLGKKKYTLTEIFWNSIFIAIVFGGICVGLFIIFQTYISSLFKEVPRSYLLISIFCIPLGILLPYLFNLFLSMNRIIKYNIIKISQPLFFIVIFMLAGLLDGFSVKLAVVSYLFSFLIAILVGILLLKKFVSGKFSYKIKILKDTINFGFKSHIGSIADYLNRRLDIFIISTLLPIVEVGYYTIAVTLTEMLWYIPKSMASILLNEVAGNKEIRDSNRFTALVCRNTLSLLIILGIIFLAINKYIVQIFYGSAFLESIKAIIILIPGIVISGIRGLLVAYVNGIGKPFISSVSAFIGLGINVPLNYIFIPVIGIAGAAWATTISYVISTGFLLIYFKATSNLKISDIVIIKKTDLQLYVKIFKTYKNKLYNFSNTGN